VDLAEIGQGLDQTEQQVGGSKQGSESQNYDDSGYFSIQVTYNSKKCAYRYKY
jgi:ataxin-3